MKFLHSNSSISTGLSLWARWPGKWTQEAEGTCCCGPPMVSVRWSRSFQTSKPALPGAVTSPWRKGLEEGGGHQIGGLPGLFGL